MNNAISHKCLFVLFTLFIFAGMSEEIFADDQSLETPFTWACRVGDIEKLKELLNDCDIDQRKANDHTELMDACRLGKEAIVDLLLAHGADVNAQTKSTETSFLSGETALVYAVGKGVRGDLPRPRIVKKLLEHGADPNRLITDDINPRETLQYTVLLDAVAGFCENCLLHRDEEVDAYEEIINLLLKYKASPNKGTLSPLMSLICPLEDQSYKDRRDALIALLINHYGANVNYKNSIGETPLHAAVECGDKHQIQLLLDAGADVSLISRSGETPLDKTDDADLKLWVQNYHTAAQPKSWNALLLFALLIPIAGGIYFLIKKNNGKRSQ